MKILVVDDETDIQTLCEQRFRKEIKEKIVEFVFKFSGEDAIAYLSEPVYEHEAILILSDINMKGMSGLELLEHIKQKYHKLPPVVMMVTAYGDGENYRIAQ